MQTHTFIAGSTNEAVERIRAELGPTAVVLSVRKLPRSGLSRLIKSEQIEVVATMESAPEVRSQDPLTRLEAEIYGLKQQFAALRLAQSVPAPESRSGTALGAILTESGLLPRLAEAVAGEACLAGGSLDEQIGRAKGILQSKWRSESIQAAGVHLFVGVPGAGKSTVLCKMLAQTTLVERQPATVYQLDSHLANCAGQTAIFAEICGAQFGRTAPECFERREECVFVDVPGVALGNEKGMSALRSIVRSFGVPEIHLVLNGAYEATHLLEQVGFFSTLDVTDLVVTHLDEEERWGKLWNLVLGTNYKVRALSCGQNIPGDLIIPSAAMVLQRQFRRK